MPASPLHLPHTNHDHPKLGRFLVVSVIAHMVFVIALTGGWFGSPRRTKPPVYFVDLVHKPVLNPQAGRPDPRPQEKTKSTPVKQAAPPAVKPEPKPQPAAAVPVKAQPTPTPKTQPQPDKLAEQQRKAAIEELRQKQAHQAKIDALKQRVAKLQQSAAVPQEVPVGMPEGTGDEVGVSVLSHIQAYIQQNWALSPYLLDRSRIATIEAKVLLAYSAAGELVRYRMVKTSGDSQFDDSIKKAIIKSKQLKQKLPQDTELTVVFNLKEMAEARK